MSYLHIYRGIPASGKTTAALKWLAEDPENRVRVNRDDIRFMTFGRYWHVDEDHVTKVQNDLLVRHMKSGREIVIDNTNLVIKHVKALVNLADKWGYGVQFHDFPIDVEEAIRRDAARDRQVGEAVIRKFYGYLRNGNFPPAPQPTDPVHFPKHEWTLGLPEAIIVDLDGTLAIHNGRSPYDDSLIHTDLVDPAVSKVIDMFDFDNKIIIAMSGRDEGNARDATEKWLASNGIYVDMLFMRPAGDRRNDAVVKNELFETNVAGRFNVLFALDDRDRVVDMWRKKGIKCFQVEPGDF